METTTKLVALVPAHNESAQIEATLDSLLGQTRVPDRIVVVADNCTDNTVELAQKYPVIVMETTDNPYRKAGALNQAWEAWGHGMDYVFTMDADTVLAADFFEKAVNLMDTDLKVGGACACPMLKPTPDTSAWGGILWRLSKLDFGGYMRILVNRKFVPEVLSGYGTVFRAEALNQIAAERGVPWDVHSIVEDYKISLDLRRLGWSLRIIPRAFAYTDAPLSLRELWTQRVRWSGGTWQELGRAGWKPYTRRVWMTSIGSLGSTALRFLALFAWTAVVVLELPIMLSWIWLIPVVVAILDRLDMTRYTKDADWKDAVLVVTLLPMELMSMLREAWTIKSAWVVVRRKNLSW